MQKVVELIIAPLTLILGTAFVGKYITNKKSKAAQNKEEIENLRAVIEELRAELTRLKTEVDTLKKSEDKWLNKYNRLVASMLGAGGCKEDCRLIKVVNDHLKENS